MLYDRIAGYTSEMETSYMPGWMVHGPVSAAIELYRPIYGYLQSLFDRAARAMYAGSFSQIICVIIRR
jgi:hypothetical protein